MRFRLAGLVAVLACLLLVTAAAPRTAPPAPSARVETHSLSATEYSVVVWLRQVPDAAGPVDSVFTTFGCTPGCSAVSHARGPVFVDSVVRPKPAVNATQSGQVFFNGKRRTLYAALDSIPWSYTNVDPAPVLAADSAQSR